MAAQLRVRYGRLARDELRCRLCATSSLPLPDSPSIRTENGELLDLALQLGKRGTGAHQLGLPGGGQLERAPQHAAQRRRIAGLGDELPGAQGARVARIGRVVLAGEHEDLHRRRMREQVGDQLEAFVGTMRRGRQAEVDQRELGGARQLAQQVDRLLAGVAGENLEIRAEGELERVGDERVIVHDQQGRLRPAAGRRRRLRRGLRVGRHGCTS
jgi:hypothetical protein